MKEIGYTITHKNETKEYQVVGICNTVEILYSGTKDECVNFISEFSKNEYIENTKYIEINVVAPEETIKYDMIHNEFEENFKWFDELLERMS